MIDPKIQNYIDKSAIQDVIAKYAICVDTGDIEGFSAIFTPDAVWRWPGAGLEYRGREALAQVALAVATHAKGTQHAISNIVVNVQGNKAQSVCQLCCFLSRPEKIYPLMLGYYEDTLIKQGGEWFFSSRDVRVENLEVLAQGVIGKYFAPLGEALQAIGADKP